MFPLLRILISKNSQIYCSVICVLFFNGLIMQAQSKTQSEMKGIYLNQVSKSSDPDSLKQLTIKLLNDESIPIDTKAVVKLTQKHPMETTLKQKIGMYLTVWMLRHFDQPKQILAFYKSLPYPWARYLMNQLIFYRQVIDKRYAKLTTRLFKDTLKFYHNDIHVPTTSSPHIKGARLKMPLEFLLLAQGAKAMPLVTHILLHRIGDWSVRLNMLATVLNMEGPDAVSLAIKYWSGYAYRAGSIKMLLDYFHQYPEKLDIKNLVALKRKQLKDALDALSDDNF